MGSSLLTRVALPPGGETDTAAALRTHGEKEGKVVFVRSKINSKSGPRPDQENNNNKDNSTREWRPSVSVISRDEAEWQVISPLGGHIDDSTIGI